VAIDIRVVAATNMTPEMLRDPRHFRQDLLFRLNTVEIELPPLRKRREDVPELMRHYLAFYARRYARPVPELSPDTLAALIVHDWPGNVRALRHAAERAVILAGDAPLTPEDFSLAVPASKPVDLTSIATSAPAELNLEKVERRLIQEALRKHGYNVSAAASDLGLSRAALYRRMEKHGI
jgi:DNA-binding NtrC family response regulator